MKSGGNTVFFKKGLESSLKLGDVFSDVFKPHSKQDGERMFIAGTELSTPKEWEMLSEWKKPWLFFRVLTAGLLITLLSYIALIYIGPTMVPMFIIAGSFATPVAVLIFFWELNVPRNIPFYDVLKMFLLGGVMSILFTVIFSYVVPEGPASYAPFSEEPAKVAALAFFLSRGNKNKYILNGILIGGAVGAGFAAIESAGYAFVYDSIDTIILRGILAPGMHVAWAAITGGALAMVKGSSKLEGRHFFNVDFLKYLAIAVALHYVWNSGIAIIDFGVFGSLMHYILIGLAWFTLLILMNKGIRQIVMVSSGKAANAPTPVSGKPVLYGLTGEYAGKTFPLNGGQVVFGRDAKLANIIFPQTTKGISRKHCTLKVEGNTLWLSDDGSSYGTFLDSNERLAPGNRVRLENGQQFYLASRQGALFEIRYQ